MAEASEFAPDWLPHLRAPRVLREQLRLIQLNFASGMLGSTSGGLVVTLALWTLMPHDGLLAWLLLHSALCLVCWLMVRRMDLRGDGADFGPQDNGRRLRRQALQLMTALGAVGACWGFMGVYAMVQAGPTLVSAALLVTCISTCAVCAGATSFCAVCMPVFTAFLALSLPPLVGYAAWQSGPVAQTMTFGGVALVLALYLFGRNIERGVLSSIELRFTNDRLLVQLALESQQANEARAAAERANQDKSRFLAAASHDLRQPVHALGLFLEALVDTGLDAGQLAVLRHAQSAADGTREMLNALLDFSRLEAGVVEPKPRALRLAPLLAALEREMGPQADAKGLAYRTRDTTLVAQADPTLVELMLRNLIGNAIRYTSEGGLLVAARWRGGRLWVEVWDTGVGIAPRDHSAVFREFHQLGNPERDRRKGLGLGLAIVHGLAGATGTLLDLRSRPGRGSCFRFGLQRSTAQVIDDEPPLATPDRLTLQGLRLLLIDDDAEVLAGMAALLGGWGAQCLLAEDIASALRLCEARAPDLILADYRLREQHTGAQAIAQLRAHFQQRLPAIIITGDTAPDRLREARNTDALLLHKPVAASQLRRALAMAGVVPGGGW